MHLKLCTRNISLLLLYRIRNSIWDVYMDLFYQYKTIFIHKFDETENDAVLGRDLKMTFPCSIYSQCQQDTHGTPTNDARIAQASFFANYYAKHKVFNESVSTEVARCFKFHFTIIHNLRNYQTQRKLAPVHAQWRSPLKLIRLPVISWILTKCRK